MQGYEIFEGALPTEKCNKLLWPAKAEKEASQTFANAAEIIAEVPGVIELRRLQTLSEIGVEHNSTIVAMFPTDILEAAPRFGVTSWFADIAAVRPSWPAGQNLPAVNSARWTSSELGLFWGAGSGYPVSSERRQRSS